MLWTGTCLHVLRSKYERSREMQGSGVENEARAMQPARKEQLTLNRAPNYEGSEERAHVSDDSDITL